MRFKTNYGIIYVNYVTNITVRCFYNLRTNAFFHMKKKKDGGTRYKAIRRRLSSKATEMAEGVKVCIVLTLKPRFITVTAHWTV